MEGRVHSLRAFVVGNQSRATITELSGHQHAVQVELSPAAALALFGQVGALNNVVVPIEEALGQWRARLVEQLGEADTWEERRTLLDGAFGALELRDGDGISPEVSWLRRQLLACEGQARVEALMDETGWSRRLVTERFRTQLGLPPKASPASCASSGRWVCSVEWAMVAPWPTWRSSADTTTSPTSPGTSSPWPAALRGALMAESTGEPTVRFLQDDGMVSSVA